jgi:hypothetical protein
MELMAKYTGAFEPVFSNDPSLLSIRRSRRSTPSI